MELVDYPPWVRNLMETKFYEPCKKHNSRKCNFFCRDCPRSTFCEACNNDNEHKDHKVFQVYKASHYPGINKKAIQECLDIDDIQLYKINANSIVYINQRPQKGNSNGAINHNSRFTVNHHHQKCRTCLRELQDNYKFCSIECKVKSNLLAETSTSNSEHKDRSKCNEDVARSTAFSSGSVGLMEEDDVVNCINRYLRKRKRKGIPRRSPLM